MSWLPRKRLHFAETAEVDRHPLLLADFIQRVLEVEAAFVSDESSLWNFHFESSNHELFMRVRDVYGVDVTDIGSGNVARILQRIASSPAAAHLVQS